MRIVPCTQGSPEWHAARRGVPTASRFGDIITAKKWELAASHREYIRELIAEELCGVQDTPTTRAMDHGTALESEARAWYEFATGASVEQVGFCMDDAGRFGCSPDGLIVVQCPNHPDYDGEVSCEECRDTGILSMGGIEIKCPTPKVHLRYLDSPLAVPDDYRAQVHGSLIITGREWWDFVSYCPPLDPLRIRVVPDEFTARLRVVLDEFWTAFQAARERHIPKEAAQ